MTPWKALLVGAAVFLAPALAAAQDAFDYHKVRLGHVDPLAKRFVAVSRDGRRIAFQEFRPMKADFHKGTGNYLPRNRASQGRIVVDGHAHDTTFMLGRPVFSPGGEHVAYAYVHQKGYAVHAAGRAIPLTRCELLGVRASALGAGPIVGAGGVVAFAEAAKVVRDGKGFAVRSYRVVHGDRRFERTYPVVEDLTLSPDGRQVAFITRDAKGWFVVVDGKPRARRSERFGSGTLRFLPDGSEITYVAGDLKEWQLVVGEDVVEKGIDFGGFTVGSMKKARQVMFVEEGKQAAVLSGAETATGDVRFWFRIRPLWFSPDAKRFAYAVRKKEGWFVVVDRRRFGPYKSCGAVFFSPDSRHFTFEATTPDEGRLVVHDGRTHASQFFVTAPVFSADGSTCAFVGRADDSDALFVNNKRASPLFEDISSVSLSADGKTVVYAAKKKGSPHWVVHRDGKETWGGRSWKPFRVFLSPDGAHVAAVMKHGTRTVVAIAGRGDAFSDVIGDRITWFDNNTARAFALQGNDVYAITIVKKGATPAVPLPEGR